MDFEKNIWGSQWGGYFETARYSPRTLCTIENVAHAFIRIFNSTLTTWDVESMTQS